LVRESELSWPGRHGEDQMGRLSNIHSQPIDGIGDPKSKDRLYEIALDPLRSKTLSIGSGPYSRRRKAFDSSA
jgi:hypothetical protein